MKYINVIKKKARGEMRKSGLALFDEVAEELALSEKTRDRYIRYMGKRWPNESDYRYAKEWGERFRDGMEYTCSDGVGKGVLELIDER